MSAQTTAQSQTVSVFTDKILNISTATTAQADTGQISKNITWDSKNYSLVKATMTLKGTQNYSSGASLNAMLNQSDVVDVNWGAFDNGTHSQTNDVTPYLTNGANIFVVYYRTAFPIGFFTDVIATFSLTLNVYLQYIGPTNSAGQPVNTSSNPVGSGASLPTGAQIMQDIQKFFSNVTNVVIAAVVIAVIGLAVYLATGVYTKGTLGSVTDALKGGLESAKEKAAKVKEKIKGD